MTTPHARKLTLRERNNEMEGNIAFIFGKFIGGLAFLGTITFAIYANNVGMATGHKVGIVIGGLTFMLEAMLGMYIYFSRRRLVFVIPTVVFMTLLAVAAIYVIVAGWDVNLLR